MRDGLRLVHSSLIGVGLRDQIRIGVAGKIVSAFDMMRALAIGADWCNSARGFMFAIGCIQSRSCHTDHCPTGVATQDRLRQGALNPMDKSEASLFKTYNFLIISDNFESRRSCMRQLFTTKKSFSRVAFRGIFNTVYVY